MSSFSRSHARPVVPGATALALAAVILGSVFAEDARAQTPDRWNTTEDVYDESHVQASLDAARTELAERHGPLALQLFEMNERLARMPHFLEGVARGPSIAHMSPDVEAGHLMHYQAGNGGSLGQLHGSTAHPVGVGWLPHSMFAEGGRLYGAWGHARLLAAVDAFTARERG